MENKKRISHVSLLLIIELIVMIIMSTVVYIIIGSATRKNSIEHMQTVANERAHIIESYIKNKEKTLTFYSKSDQVKNLLNYVSQNTLDKNAQSYIDTAYEYTLDYSADIDNLEGIYVSKWSSLVLAQTHFKYPETVLTTRETPEELNELHEGVKLAGDGVYNLGTIISPASQTQIVSMYKAVYDEKSNPIGIVGLGISTKGLVDSLNALEIQGIKDASYSMVNVADAKYVFNEDPNLVEQKAENSEIINICKKLKGQTEEVTGSFEYKNNGVRYISNYSYIPEYGWILMIDDTKKEVYSLTKVMSIYMAIFGLLIIALIGVFAFINKKQEDTNKKLASSIVKNNKTTESLYTAMFKDVLTDVRNRIAFSMDFDDNKAPQSDTHYFVMYNICDFSKVNSQHGNDTGDWLLVKSVDIIGQIFKNGTIYRTGSDEFVVSIPVEKNKKSADDIISDAQSALNRLSAEYTSPVGKLSFRFKSAVVQKNGEINTSIITVLKEMITNDQDDSTNHVSYANLNQH